MSIDRRGLLGAGIAAPIILGAGAASAADTVAQTAYGRVSGRIEDGVHVFKGVPYGAPTSGKNRFMAPVRPQPWTGVRQATAYGQTAPQLLLRDRRVFGERATLPTQGEDCLMLNVWTPALSGKRPVMVWLHGGGFSQGSGSAAVYDGRNLTARQDVVLVTINHRLNLLGFLDLSEVSDAFPDSANTSLLDIVAALQWVKQNIAGFGGDPGRVTIFGQSGGGLKVASLMAVPQAKGLFHRAIMQSGTYVRARERPVMRKSTRGLMAELGVPTSDPAKLQELPWEKLVAAGSAMAARDLASTDGFWAGIDGRVLTHHPFDPKGPPESASVPLMVGYTRTETTFSMSEDKEAFALDDAGLLRRVDRLVGAMAPSVVEAYRADYGGATPSDLFFMIATDLRNAAGSNTTLERKAAQGGAPAWAYRFDWKTPVQGGRLRSPHTVDLPFVFDNVERSSTFATVGSSAPRGLASAMSGAWAAFARTGDPNHAGLPAWAPFTAEARNAMLFDAPPSAAIDPDGRERKAILAARA